MRPASLILSFILALAAAFSCATRDRFEGMETLIRTAPDSALYVLDNVDTTLLGAADKARYTLLCMDAELGAFGSIILTTKDRIRRAAQYFEWEGDEASIARMWTLLAREQSLQGNDAEAARYWSYAAGLLESSNRQARESLRTLRLRTIIIILFLFLALVIGYNYHRLQKIQAARQLEQERSETERAVSIAEDLKSRLQEAGRPKGRLADNFAVLERLCEQYYVYEGTDNLQPKILREVRQVIGELRSDPAYLEEALNRSHDGLMSRFRTQFPALKEDDHRLFCLLAAGFSSTTISTLLEKDKQYIYNRIYRLKGRISSSSAPDKELFLSSIGK